jgi:hypothetical protein
MSDGWKRAYDERLPGWLNTVLDGGLEALEIILGLCAYLVFIAAIYLIGELWRSGVQNIGVIGCIGVVGVAIVIIASRGWAERLFRSFGHGKLVIGILVLSWFMIDGYDWPIWPLGIFACLLMLTIVESSYWVSRGRASWFGGLLLAVALLPSGLYSLRLYNQIESDFRDSENRIVPPTIDEESVSEIGYIYDLKREIDFRKIESDYGMREITWYVKIPSTAKFYTCHWASGYSRFSKDDGVEVIHKKNEPGVETDTSFLVGLNGEQRGRSAGCFW